jgi:hypothetical protein
MPRRKLIRHFEARYGVSREMVNIEAKHVAREHESYMLQSSKDLAQQLQDVRTRWHEADQTVEALVHELPERDALAFQCLLARDLWLILELYGSCLRTKRDERGDEPLVPATPPQPLNVRITPFSEWLFEPSG